MTKFFERILKILFNVLIFLVPLFFLPFSFEKIEFNKQYLIFFLVSFSFLIWLLKMVLIDKEIHVSKNLLDIFILIFLLVAIFSTIFSVDKYNSLFGSYGRFSNGLISLFVFVLFYFLIKNNPNTNFINPLFVSVFLVVLFSYFSLFAFFKKISLPFGQNILNLISNSWEGLAVFLAIFIVFLVSKILFLEKWGPKQLGYFLLLILSLGLLIIFNFNPAWFILILSFSLFLIYVLKNRIFKEEINRLLLPIFLIFLSLTFLFINYSFFQLPKEQILTQRISWQICLAATKESVKNLFLGSGIGNWQYIFLKFKPVEFNNTPFWPIRHDRAGSYISEVFGTMGILGIVSYFLLFINFFVLFLIIAKNQQQFLISGMGVLAAFLGQFFYSQNTSLAFLFWVFLGGSMGNLFKPPSEKIYSFKKFPELSLILSSLLILLIILIGISYFFAIKFYLADVNYNQGFWTSSIKEKTKFFEKAANLNKNSMLYQVVLAQSYLLQLQEELLKPSDQQNPSTIQNLIIEAINRAKKATEISPKNVASWETLGMVYRDIQPLVQGATEWAIKSFEEAIKLEPNNPVFYTEIGKLYLSSNISKAKENFAKAKQLKPDYVDALIFEALTFEIENNLDEATKKMEEIISQFPYNIDARFHLGRLYFNKEKINEAIFQFEQILSLSPNHANSLYFLGLCYSKINNKEKAISYFEKVLELNPGNQDVIQKIEELKK